MAALGCHGCKEFKTLEATLQRRCSWLVSALSSLPSHLHTPPRGTRGHAALPAVVIVRTASLHAAPEAHWLTSKLSWFPSHVRAVPSHRRGRTRCTCDDAVPAIGNAPLSRAG